ncbi:MAG: hypothetical protein WCL18_02110 [bacterium]
MKKITTLIGIVLIGISLAGKAQISQLVTMNDTITINSFIKAIDSLDKKKSTSLTDYQTYFQNEKTIWAYLCGLDHYIAGLERYFLLEENGKFRVYIQAKRTYYNNITEKREKELERVKKRFK